MENTNLLIKSIVPFEGGSSVIKFHTGISFTSDLGSAYLLTQLLHIYSLGAIKEDNCCFPLLVVRKFIIIIELECSLLLMKDGFSFA